MTTASSAPARPFTVCVYCGSRFGVRPAYAAAADAVGRAIGERGWSLVYGGGRVGLMGRVADAALAAGAHVTGVIPRSLQVLEVGHAGLDELHVVETMHQRKQLMAERADAFVALPGGIGTLEELFEVWTWRQLGYHHLPLGLLDVDGYWAPLVTMLTRSVAEGFVGDATASLLKVASDAAALLDALHAEAAASCRHGVDDRI